MSILNALIYRRKLGDYEISNTIAKTYDEFWNVAPTMLNYVIMYVIENLFKEMNKKEAIDILKEFVDHEKSIGFYSNATKGEVEAMEFAIKYMEECT